MRFSSRGHEHIDEVLGSQLRVVAVLIRLIVNAVGCAGSCRRGMGDQVDDTSLVELLTDTAPSNPIVCDVQEKGLPPSEADRSRFLDDVEPRPCWKER